MGPRISFDRENQMLRQTARIATALAALVLVAGCEHAMLEDTIFDKEYVARHLPNEEKVLSATTFKPRPTGVVQTYCYSSIGEVECYAQPQEGERYRLNGYYGPAPE
tara:strand:- start:5912 stop:6232 length:321 start_codon:yes stop_codon:yes gene_type:complete